jgi:hypothetical protein
MTRENFICPVVVLVSFATTVAENAFSFFRAMTLTKIYFVGLLLLVGCAVPARQASNPVAVALAIRILGGGTPTPQQLTNVHRAMEPQLARAGYRFAPNVNSADAIVSVNFTPDPADPNGGRVTVMGVEFSAEMRRALASGADQSDEARDMRRRLREIEQWTERQAKGVD